MNSFIEQPSSEFANTEKNAQVEAELLKKYEQEQQLNSNLNPDIFDVFQAELPKVHSIQSNEELEKSLITRSLQESVMFNQSKNINHLEETKSGLRAESIHSENIENGSAETPQERSHVPNPFIKSFEVQVSKQTGTEVALGKTYQQSIIELELEMQE